MRRFGLNRGQDSHDDYAKRLASWQLERGLNGADLTPAQTERLRAVEQAGGDIRTARRLLFGRLRYRTGSLNDDKR